MYVCSYLFFKNYIFYLIKYWNFGFKVYINVNFLFGNYNYDDDFKNYYYGMMYVWFIFVLIRIIYGSNLLKIFKIVSFEYLNRVMFCCFFGMLFKNLKLENKSKKEEIIFNDLFLFNKDFLLLWVIRSKVFIDI